MKMIYRQILLQLFFVTTLFSQTIEVAPNSIAVTLVSGDSTEVALTISNTGIADLTYAVPGDTLLVEFTNCGAEGRFGPTQAMCDSAYFGTEFEGQITVPDDAGIQEWVAPFSGIYTIEIWGAQGGGSYSGIGGYGAKMKGKLSLQINTVLRILVGHQGSGDNGDQEASGGGGSFIAISDDIPLIIAGGGGGSVNPSYDDNRHGTINENGNDATGTGNPGLGGTNGDGGFSGRAGAGGGFYGNGENGDTNPNNSGGFAFINSGIGGVGALNNNEDGGFGGGGGNGNDEADLTLPYQTVMDIRA